LLILAIHPKGPDRALFIFYPAGLGILTMGLDAPAIISAEAEGCTYAKQGKGGRYGERTDQVKGGNGCILINAASNNISIAPESLINGMIRVVEGIVDIT
jgi:hypothetical protein